jgi:hypothetical protein
MSRRRDVKIWIGGVGSRAADQCLLDEHVDVIQQRGQETEVLADLVVVGLRDGRPKNTVTGLNA